MSTMSFDTTEGANTKGRSTSRLTPTVPGAGVIARCSSRCSERAGGLHISNGTPSTPAACCNSASAPTGTRPFRAAVRYRPTLALLRSSILARISGSPVASPFSSPFFSASRSSVSTVTVTARICRSRSGIPFSRASNSWRVSSVRESASPSSAIFWRSLDWRARSEFNFFCAAVTRIILCKGDRSSPSQKTAHALPFFRRCQHITHERLPCLFIRRERPPIFLSDLGNVTRFAQCLQAI